MKKLLLILLALTYMGCDRMEFGKTPSPVANNPYGIPANATRVKAESLNDELKIKVVGTDPKKYAIQFSWPYLEDNKFLRIRLGNVLAEVLPSQTFFTHVLSHNQTVTFSFDILDMNRKLERTINKTVVIPTDYVVSEENVKIVTDTKIEVNRFYLNPDLPFTINTLTVSIVANEFHAEKGIIQTFPENVLVHDQKSNTDEQRPPTADDFKPGRAGGNISITATKLFGRMKVYMRGENGGPGYAGEAKEGQKAGVGKPAGNGVWTCDVPNPCDHNPNACFFEDNNRSRIHTRALNRTCSCENYGMAGGIGLEGDKGNTGKPGMPGGAAGSIRVSIHEYVPAEGIDEKLPQEDDRVIQIFQIPGKGGKGGEGGEGQRGSPGGLGRDPRNRMDCRGANGPEGAQGKKGDQGPIGKTGDNGLKCVYVGSENINECSQ